MFRLRSQVNIQTILRLDRIQEIRQNVAKQNKNSEYQINENKYRTGRIVTHARIHMHTHAHTCTHIQTHTYTCTHIHTYTCTHIQTHKHTHAHT